VQAARLTQRRRQQLSPSATKLRKERSHDGKRQGRLRSVTSRKEEGNEDSHDDHKEEKASDEAQKVNPFAAELSNPLYKPRVVRPRKGRGSYNRKKNPRLSGG
jgi:stalled ribosome alternative rescue factor ArfA